MSRKILVGCDPEVFVRNPNSQQFVCAHGLVPGDKHNPHKVNFGAVQVDGMALEFNIDPAANKNEFIQRNQAVLETLASMVPGYSLVPQPFAEFEQAYFDSCPETAKELGCEPDYNAYTMDVNPRPDGNPPVRTAAGHIHVGWTENKDIFEYDHFVECCNVVKTLDYYVGINTVLFDPDNRRRSMYGKAGAFRPKTYGVEYRVPSNAWLTSTDLMSWIYDATITGVNMALDGNALTDELAQSIINDNITDWPERYPELAHLVYKAA